MLQVGTGFWNFVFCRFLDAGHISRSYDCMYVRTLYVDGYISRYLCPTVAVITNARFLPKTISGHVCASLVSAYLWDAHAHVSSARARDECPEGKCLLSGHSFFGSSKWTDSSFAKSACWAYCAHCARNPRQKVTFLPLLSMPVTLQVARCRCRCLVATWPIDRNGATRVTRPSRYGRNRARSWNWNINPPHARLHSPVSSGPAAPWWFG